MSKYDRDILIENIKLQMKKHDISQQQLAESIGMSQPNVSKSLNTKEKKNFTVAQLADIADLFHTSVDSLLGGKSAAPVSHTPRAVAAFLVQIIERGDASLFDYEKEEDTYEYHDNQWPPETVHEKKTIKYPAFYLPNYWYIPSDATDDQEQELYSEISQVGNETDMGPINEFLRHFREIYAIYKKGDLSEDTYRSVLSDMLSKLRD